MERDLAVERGFGLQDFGKPPQRIEAAMREMGFEVGRQRVSLQAGSI